MSRNAEYSALILRSRPSGESNRDVWLLAVPVNPGADAGAGLLRATVFGGPKSKLRAHAAPFHSGQAWIYHDPVRDSRKLSDFDVRSWRPGLRELYERAMCADAIAETVLASHGGGGLWEEALALAEAALDTLENAGEELCRRILVRFLWRWAGLLGLQPELDRCVVCGKALAETGGAELSLWYSGKEGGVLCASCVENQRGPGGNAGLLRLGAASRRWLNRPVKRPHQTACLTNETKNNLICETMKNNQSPPGAVTANGMAASPAAVDKPFKEAKALVFAVLTEALGKRLASWDF
jgi:DNA repair protein RecO (recombination protein O)